MFSKALLTLSSVGLAMAGQVQDELLAEKRNVRIPISFCCQVKFKVEQNLSFQTFEPVSI